MSWGSSELPSDSGKGGVLDPTLGVYHLLSRPTSPLLPLVPQGLTHTPRASPALAQLALGRGQLVGSPRGVRGEEECEERRLFPWLPSGRAMLNYLCLVEGPASFRVAVLQ